MHDHISVFCLVSSEGALSRSLLVAHGRRRRRDAHWHAAKDMRDRVFTLLMRAYTEAQFAIAYVRRYDEQSDRRLPSIWGRTRTQAPNAKARAERNGYHAERGFAHADIAGIASRVLACGDVGSA